MQLADILSSLHIVGEDRAAGAAPLPWYRLVLSSAAPLLVIAISYHLNLGINKTLLVAVVRSAVQLMLAGYVILSFIFSIKSITLSLLYLFCTMIIAAIEVTARQTRTYVGHFRDAVISVMIGGGIVGLYGSTVVFSPTPWWKPDVMIPTAGMIIGNAVSGPAVSVERLLAEVCEKTHEVETRLAFGASSFEAILPTVKASVAPALMPMVNSMAVVGLVSIPGMMVGQMLGGSSPLAAAEYQLAIFWLISGTVAFSTYVGVSLAVRHAVFDQNHRLTPHRVMTKEKMDTISAIIENMKNCFLCFRGNRTEVASPSYEIVQQAVDSSLHAPAGQDLDSSQSQPHISQRTGKVTYSIIAAEAASAMKTTSPVFEINGLNVLSGEHYLFSNTGLDIKIKSGERISIEGVSGIGKTRLLRAIANLDVIPIGACKFLDANNLSNNSEWRCRCLYVPQALPPLSGSPSRLIEEIISCRSRKRLVSRQLNQEELAVYSRRMESSLGLSTNKLDQTWGSFSGGERQRAAIGVALILSAILTSNSNQASVLDNPGAVVLLLDEPTSACDKLTALRVEEALCTAGISIIMITHDHAQAIRFATRRIIFKEIDCYETAAQV